MRWIDIGDENECLGCGGVSSGGIRPRRIESED